MASIPVNSSHREKLKNTLEIQFHQGGSREIRFHFLKPFPGGHRVYVGDPHSAGGGGSSPVHIAAGCCQLEALRLLHENGVNMQARGSFCGWTGKDRMIVTDVTP